VKRFKVCVFVLLAAVGVVAGQAQSQEVSGQGNKGYLAKFNGRLTIGNSTLFQNSDGNVGVGTTFPAGRLDVMSNFGGGGPTVLVENANPYGDDAIDFHSAGSFVGNLGMITSEQPTRFFILHNSDIPAMPLTLAENGGNVGIGTNNPTNILTIRQGAGDAIADGWVTYSSKQWKTSIQPLEGALDKVEHLRGVSFDWKSTGKHDIGLIAEEAAAVVPEVVAVDPADNKVKGIEYSRLTALLIEAVKEQQSQIAELQQKLENLREHSSH
jgi:Chaperone of endosialidase